MRFCLRIFEFSFGFGHGNKPGHVTLPTDLTGTTAHVSHVRRTSQLDYSLADGADAAKHVKSLSRDFLNMGKSSSLVGIVRSLQ